jgi:hypothetical protein
MKIYCAPFVQGACLTMHEDNATDSMGRHRDRHRNQDLIRPRADSDRDYSSERPWG